MTTRVAVLSTGGTIASRRDDTGAAVASVTSADLVAGLAPADVEVATRDLFTVDSSALTLEQLDAVREAVADELADPGVAGVVVTHGTDTMEETSLLVDLSHADPRPIVFTGAQRAADAPEPDGPANLAAAIAAAADPSLRGYGVLLCFGGSLRTVRGVSKVHTSRPQPFAGGAEVPAPVPRRMLLSPRPVAGLRVEVVSSYPGADGAVLRGVVAAGVDGVVLQATGGGNTTTAVADAVRDVVEAGVPVVVCTRVCEGVVDAEYGGGGGALDLMQAGAVLSRRLRAGQARIALLALLASGVGEQWITTYFAV
ncbi:asparaginase domain-containing protein [Tsukamurella sp. 8F]|uniref:asparaginase domain-containing protein n=1 Tax=unclassified Tsukamurella TaxID=2633480 RepID=UPI0023BA1F5A|nr:MULTISPECIES: asparaginase domain-containing protein [unclassified Tsukamurella]MDF0532448.1 asparaginase domain-containing protein [Tsukamurella sp. 8J]MDF0588459.1 asparaginase domain-containing protein [Tsukamurella sp. 8F]